MPPAKTGFSNSVSRLKIEEEGEDEEGDGEGAGETEEGGGIVSGAAMVTV